MGNYAFSSIFFFKFSILLHSLSQWGKPYHHSSPQYDPTEGSSFWQVSTACIMIVIRKKNVAAEMPLWLKVLAPLWEELGLSPIMPLLHALFWLPPAPDTHPLHGHPCGKDMKIHEFFFLNWKKKEPEKEGSGINSLPDYLSLWAPRITSQQMESVVQLLGKGLQLLSGPNAATLYPLELSPYIQQVCLIITHCWWESNTLKTENQPQVE